MTARASILFCALLIVGCSSSRSSSPSDGGDGPHADVPSTNDSSGDAVAMCTYAAGGGPADGAAFNGICPSGGCPSGTVCVVEVGGVGGGGGEYCAPIPNECHGTPRCACMAACVCTNKAGLYPEACSEKNGTIACDNGIR